MRCFFSLVFGSVCLASRSFRTLVPLGNFFHKRYTVVRINVNRQTRCSGTSGNLNTQSLLDPQTQWQIHIRYPFGLVAAAPVIRPKFL